MENKNKIFTIVIAVLLVSVLTFGILWGTSNWGAIRHGMGGADLYTRADLENAHNDGLRQGQLLREQLEAQTRTLLFQIEELNREIVEHMAEIERVNIWLDELLALIDEDYLESITNLLEQIQDLTQQRQNLNNQIQSHLNQISNLNDRIQNLEQQLSDMTTVTPQFGQFSIPTGREVTQNTLVRIGHTLHASIIFSTPTSNNVIGSLPQAFRPYHIPFYVFMISIGQLSTRIVRITENGELRLMTGNLSTNNQYALNFTIRLDVFVS
ncbi:MAG: hypothetical protein FWE01_01065 [Firmicutes bacterium]|nr:hypothetical protein [Bacillota bacterium]